MRARFSRLIALCAALALCCATPADAAKKSKSKRSKGKIATSAPLVRTVEYEKRTEVREFIDSLVTRHGFSSAELMTVFAKTRYQDSVARLMMPATSSQPKSWTAYRQRFVEPRRIAAGVRFCNDNLKTLRRASERFGVPQSIILGIIGVETIYGRNTGNYRVIDALATLAFNYPNKERDRSPFFRAQLEDYLLFVREAGLDVFEVLGSYAGAIGMPQFMPGSYRRFAIDFDGDNKIDLRSNAADTIGSVANFLVEHGWVRGAPIYFRTALPAELPSAELARLIAAGSEPTLRADLLRQLGFVFDATVPGDTLLALIDLPNEGEATASTEYVFGTHNFNTLTRYNRSYFYAMAVTDLGAAIEAAVPR